MAVSFGRFGVVLAGFGLLASGWSSAVFGETFYLKTGDVIEGTILDATRNTVTLRVGGAVRPTSLGQIDHVVVTLADGGELSGSLVGWRDGVLELRSAADEVVRVADGRLLRDDGKEVASTAGDVDEASAPAVSMQGVPELILTDGRVLVGRIIHATGSIVTIRKQTGGIMPTSRAQLEAVRFVDGDGTVVSGELVDWSDDVYRLRLADDRELLAHLDEGALASGSTVASAPAPAVIASTDAAALPAAEDAAALEAVGAGGPAQEEKVAALAVEDDGSVAIRPAASSPRFLESEVPVVSEDGDAVVFKFRLDHPADRPLVILYAATDDTAKAGEDFEAQSGVITFAAGSSFAEIRVPLIDDDDQEPSEQFHLFLSGDPDAIEFGQRQIVATIQDDD